jgi:hypothetical protein
MMIVMIVISTSTKWRQGNSEENERANAHSANGLMYVLI